MMNTLIVIVILAGGIAGAITATWLLDAVSHRLARTWLRCRACDRWMHWTGRPGEPIFTPATWHVKKDGLCDECRAQRLFEGQ